MISRTILLGLMLVVFPLMFIWHTELFMLSLVRGGVHEFTNGWISSSPVRTYHLFMYLLLTINLVGAYQLIKLGEKKR